MLAEGRWQLHQFSLPDDNAIVRSGATLYPLRFMAANAKITTAHLLGVLDYVTELGRELEGVLP
jgi:L-2,4-diaminobutyrate decarboxylase